MTALPSASSITGSSVTEGDVKNRLTELRAYLADLFGADGTQATALGTLGALMNGSVAKTTGYTVVAADRGKLIDCSGTWTLAIDPVATLGAGFAFAVRNSGSGTITINPDLSEPIDDVSTIDLGPGESCVLIVNATADGLRTVGRTVSADGSFRSIQIFTSSGTWNKPTGLRRVKVTVVGGGGGGGGVSSGSSSIAYGGGGGGGGASIEVIEAGLLSASETVTVGAAGTAGGAGASGGAGGTSSFGTYLSATGGSGGAGAVSSNGAGGAGGTGANGNLNFSGDFGFDPIATSVATRSGSGGASLYAGSARGVTTETNGTAGNGYGGGGSGGMCEGTGGSQTGGAGSAGIVIVEEFF